MWSLIVDREGESGRPSKQNFKKLHLSKRRYGGTLALIGGLLTGALATKTYRHFKSKYDH